MDARLLEAAGCSDQKTKMDLYKGILGSLGSCNLDDVKAVVDHLISDDVPLVLSRQLLLIWAQELSRLPPEQHKPAAQYGLERLQPRVVSFEDTVTALREGLAAALEKEEEWTKAAEVLAGIDMDTSSRQVDPQLKLRHNIRIAMLYLEDDDSVSAEMYLKKAGALVGVCADDGLQLQFKVCYARILDAKRRFLEAASRYYELSTRAAQVGNSMVDEDELVQALQAAISCAILAAAGPQRSRLLATLYKDERSARLPLLFPFLEKVYMERILTGPEVSAFAATLKPHQVAKLPDGATVLDRAVMQHNVLSASKLYDNIRTHELGAMLGVTPEKAENIAADMIAEGRMRGSIDQVEQLICFDTDTEPLLQWDQQIQAACVQVGSILEAAQAAGKAAA